MAEQQAKAEVIDLSRFRETHPQSSSISSQRTVSVVPVDRDDQHTLLQTTLDDLYGDARDGSDLVQVARRILLECEQHILAAIDAASKDDPLGADLEASRAFAIWPELFLCRSISEGLGAAVLGIHYAYLNAVGDLFSNKQLQQLADSVAFLVQNPFLNFDRALDLLDDLDDCGLKVDPPEASALGEILVQDQ